MWPKRIPPGAKRHVTVRCGAYSSVPIYNGDGTVRTFIERRRSLSETYIDRLSGLGVSLPAFGPGDVPYRFVTEVDADTVQLEESFSRFFQKSGGETLAKFSSPFFGSSASRMP